MTDRLIQSHGRYYKETTNYLKVNNGNVLRNSNANAVQLRVTLPISANERLVRAGKDYLVSFGKIALYFTIYSLCV